MKLQVLQENLVKAVSITSRFANAKAQLPILGNILLSVKRSKIYLSSTNLEISASVQVGAKIEEEGEISLPAKIISELVSNLPKETVNLSSEKEQLKVSVPGFSSMVLGMDPTDFPKVPTSLDKDKTVSVKYADLVNSLSKILFATSIDETRPILTGVLFMFSKKDLSMVATDGFRLSRKKVEFEGLFEGSKKIVVPKGVLSEISRISENEGNVLIGVKETEKQILFGEENVVLTSRLLEGEYPDFEKIIPKAATIKVTLDKEELLRAVKLASIFARESANIVRIKVLKDSIKVYAESGSSGNQETKVDAKVESDEKEFEIAFNYRFVEDFLHSVSGEEVRMEFSGVSSAGVFVDTSDPNYLHLIMPVKIQG